MPDIKLGLDAVLELDGVEVTNVRDLAVAFSKAEADVTTRNNQGWRAVVGTLKEAEITFMVMNAEGDSTFDDLYTKFLSGDPVEVSISDAGATVILDCEVMGFEVNQGLEEGIGANVTMKPTYAEDGAGINNAAPAPPPGP
jgi:hypothetical protein